VVDLSSYPISSIRRAGGLLFVSGQLPIDKQGKLIRGDIREQTKLVIANLAEVLASEGASLANVVKITTWLSDAEHAEGYNTIYKTMFATPYPARSTIVSQLLVASDIELEAVAEAR
jgi:2-iminobutanoate/2-iminopropanoate deaminase